MSNTTNFFYRNRSETYGKLYFKSWLLQVYFSTVELLRKSVLKTAVKKYTDELNNATTMCKHQKLSTIVKKLEQISQRFLKIPQRQRKEMFSEAYQVEKRRREEQERQQNLEIIRKNIAKIINNCSDAYWVLGSHYPLCRGNHMSLNGSGIPLDEVLKAYPENAVPDQPIIWKHTLKFPDKSIAVDA
ncbi:hypothetical protein F8M41_021243 [Gigaspora margarita]|uniref:Uncharacterized protein n=1 Tax=Gigaspora margarita TaxID=4874 RepID=A0A8H4EJ35_GIGMA|nr:hypothetical protein F8M41_021243 [Gigaspora margarita]